MKIIPTPHIFNYTKENSPLTVFSSIVIDREMDETICWGINELKKKFSVPCENGSTLTLVHSDNVFFQEKNASEQGYILTRKGNNIVLEAQTSIGFMYGLMTLLQFYGDAPEEFEIKDRPAIRLRGNMNTLWAECAVWSYDFGDGLEAVGKRLRTALDEAARAKLNLMYVDGLGFGNERFPGYNKLLKEISEYANIRGIKTMIGAYGMDYGFINGYEDHKFMGKVFRNRYPYPDGELYKCIGLCRHDENASPDSLIHRSYGTCLSNDELIEDKISEIREYLTNTGVSVIYLHNMDADEIHEPLWLGRCDHCRKKFPNDSLYAKDGCAGAFAAYFDQILNTLLPEFPNLVLCPVAPGYASHPAGDYAFGKCLKFWSAVFKYAINKDSMIPTFREFLMQHDEPKLRYDLLEENLDAYGCVFFSSGDGAFSDKIFTPSAAYVKVMHKADMMICANGGALQKPTQYTNAEYMWNPDNSAFWNIDILDNYEDMQKHYNALREGSVGRVFNAIGPTDELFGVDCAIRPKGIYGEDGLLERSCALLFGEKYAKRIADIFRIRGKNGECPIFTASNMEIGTYCGALNFGMLWDQPINREYQLLYRERFAECTITTLTAKKMLDDLLEEDDLCKPTREHLAYLRDASDLCVNLCGQLTRYMDLYIEADAYFKNGATITEDFIVRANGLIRDSKRTLKKIESVGLKSLDPLGGINIWRDKCFDFIAYSTGQILQSIMTEKRIPDDRRTPKVDMFPMPE